MNVFINQYGKVSAHYRERPTYPEALFSWLSFMSPDNELALDCACGTGQASVGLARHFDRVIGTDFSEEQLSHAFKHERITYCCRPASDSGVRSHSVDLLTVGMAAHWFDLASFYSEAARVLKPGGLLALWHYTEPFSEDASITKVMDSFTQSMRPYFPEARVRIERTYAEESFPFEKRLTTPSFFAGGDYTLDRLVTYFRSRSFVVNALQKTGVDLTQKLKKDLLPLWGGSHVERKILWPLYIQAAHVNVPKRQNRPFFETKNIRDFEVRLRA